MSEHPQVIVLAGPNGAGKTTSSDRLLPEAFSLDELVNADLIAAGLAPAHPEGMALQAGRLMLGRLRELASLRADFAFETTLAARGLATHLAAWRREGYRIHLIFLWLPDVSVALGRVARRVAAGGHDIPPPVVRRRFTRGWANFHSLYRPLADTWRVFDTSGRDPRLLARGEQREVEILEPRLWRQFQAPPSSDMSVREPSALDVKIEAAIRKATRAAIEEHWRHGRSIVIWRDGRVVIVPPEEIPALLELDVPVAKPATAG